jgi:hypothetical protein
MKTTTHYIFDGITTKAEIRTVDGHMVEQFDSVVKAWDYVKTVMRPSNPKVMVRRVKEQYQGSNNGTAPTVNGESVDVRKQFSVARRFAFMKKMTQMVAKGTAAGAVICGPAGIGKTFSVTQVLEDEGMREGYHFEFIKGNMSPLGLYETMYRNQDKLIVFDDCDSALFNPQCANLLKAALDTCDRRVITWMSSAMDREGGLPSQFEFSGQILFISNLDQEKIDDAIVSRTLCLDLRMDESEILDRIEQLAPVICSALAPVAITEIITFLRDNLKGIFDLNLRTLIKLAKVRQDCGEDWQDMATYLFTR